MLIYGVDPGTIQSGVVIYDTVQERVRFADIIKNSEVWSHRAIEHEFAIDAFAVEMVSHYGRNMPAGASLFETCVWIGRFIEAWNQRKSTEQGHAILVYRRDQKLHLCDTPRAGDKEIRQALLDRFGGNRKIALGVKKHQGPLFGIKSHSWNALAVALTAYETVISKNQHWLTSPINDFLVS